MSYTIPGETPADLEPVDLYPVKGGRPFQLESAGFVLARGKIPHEVAPAPRRARF